MNRHTRKVILIGTIFLFIFITPVILLYAAGYSFNWQTKEPVLTGAFYIRSTPKNASVYLDEKLLDQNTPVFIKNLKPGKYHLKVTKNKYRTWQKNLTVKPQLVTEANHIFLPRFNPTLNIIKNNLKKDLSLSQYIKNSNNQEGEKFYIQKSNQLLYKTDTQKSFNEQITLKPLPKGQEYQIFQSSDDVAVLGEKDNKLYLLDKENQKFKSIASNVKNAQFSKDNKKLLFFNNFEIWVYYLKEVQSQPPKKVKTKELITRLSKKINQAIWYPQTNYHIIFSTSKKVKLIELDNRDYRNTLNLFNFSVDQIQYNQEKEKLYFTKNNKLFTADLK